MKAAVIYYSNSGVTKELAERIKAAFGGELFEVKPVVPYGKYWAAVKRAGKERRKGIVAEYTAPEGNPAEADCIFIGYPIWYSEVPAFLLDYVKKLDLKGKTVIPFATSGSTNIEKTLEQLKGAVGGAEVVHPYGEVKEKKDGFEGWVKEVREGLGNL